MHVESTEIKLHQPHKKTSTETKSPLCIRDRELELKQLVRSPDGGMCSSVQRKYMPPLSYHWKGMV